MPGKINKGDIVKVDRAIRVGMGAKVFYAWRTYSCETGNASW